MTAGQLSGMNEAGARHARRARTLAFRGHVKLGAAHSRSRARWVGLVLALRIVAALVLFYFCAAHTGNMRPDQGLSNAAFGR